MARREPRCRRTACAPPDSAEAGSRIILPLTATAGAGAAGSPTDTCRAADCAATGTRRRHGPGRCRSSRRAGRPDDDEGPTTSMNPAATAEGSKHRPPARRVDAGEAAAGSGSARTTGSVARRARSAARKWRSRSALEARSSERSTSPIRCHACHVRRNSASVFQAPQTAPAAAAPTSPSASADSRSASAEPFSNPDDMSVSTSTPNANGGPAGPPLRKPHQRSPSRVSSSGRSRVAIASRARKIRDRTVPIGQFISSAISS